MIVTYSYFEPVTFTNLGSEFYGKPWMSDCVWIVPGTWQGEDDPVH